ncbi:MAG: CotH kinase family protein [Bacteroidota bacterium]
MKNLIVLLALLGIVLIPFSSATAQIVINEFMSSNSSTLEDEDGDSSDWLELFNTSSEAVSLVGYALSDDTDDLNKWLLPDLSIPPESYLLIYCSGKNRSVVGQPLHANFKLSAEGEDVLLVQAGETIQHILPVALETDLAYAALPGDSQTFLITSLATPGESNMLDIEVHFSHEAGFYENAIELSLDIDDPAFEQVEIRYTLNGDDPDMDAAIYNNSILVDDRTAEENILANIPCTPDFTDWNGEAHYPEWTPPQEKLAKGSVLRVAAFVDGRRISQIATRTYFVFPEGKDRYTFPVVSISCPSDSLFSFERGIYVTGAALESDNLLWSGNYFNSGRDWERASSFEYFYDGEAVINQDIGIRIHGGKTRGAAQKTLRLYARSSYGKKRFDFPFFSKKDQSSYKRLLLRTSMGAWTNTIIADAFAHQASRDLNFDIQEYQPVIVFINGEYWGIHELREHFDEHKIADDHGLEEEDIKIYASYGNVIEGETDTDFYHLRDQYLTQNDITGPEVYDYVKERIDIDNFIDYFFTEIYFNNPDWPGNNSKMWRSAAYDNKFRWLFYDIDGGMDENRIDENLLAKIVGGASAGGEDHWSNALIRTLIKNETFREQFISRGKYLLQETFSPEVLAPLVQQMTAEYEAEMDEHFGRWQGWLSTATWRDNISTHIRQFIFLRACEMETQMIDFFGIKPFLECNKEELSDIQVYPNPSQGIFNIALDVNREGPYFCLVHNQLGQLLKHESIVLSSFGGTLDLSNLPPGGYYLSILNGQMEEIKTKQIIIH